MVRFKRRGTASIMTMTAVGTLLTIGVIATLTLLWLEVTQYRRGRSLLSPKRLWIRVLGGVLLILLLIAIFTGLFFFDLLRPTDENVMVWGFFWSGCVILGLALIVLAFEDFKAVTQARREQETAYWRDVASMVADAAPRGRGRQAQTGDLPPAQPADGNGRPDSSNPS